MKILPLCALALGLTAVSVEANENVMKELAPSGKLRVGIVFAPVMSTFFVIKDEARKPKGVTVDIGDALAKKLNLPVEFVLYPNSGQVTEAPRNRARLRAG
jgi:polar amino acid transport system substrate-binding protein